jgi:nucleoside-diphosphate-sugar epimerase
MLVAVTGGTGFLGANTTSALHAAGHRTRLLAGDVTDRGAVAELLRGADAVLHAAAVYSFDRRKRATVLRTNESGTRTVLDAARGAGLPVTYVSTIAALFPAAELDVDTPVGTPREPYAASKAAAERVARAHQAEGAPVTIVYPPALIGPDDPRLGDQTTRLRNALRGLMPVWPTGGFPLGDVRDTAALLAALVDRPGGRHFGPNHHLSTADYLAALREVTGRALPAARLPARGMLPLGKLVDALQLAWPWHLPAEYGAIYTCACDAHVLAPTEPARPVTETFADTVSWLYEHGHLSARMAGRVAARAHV